MRQHAVVIWVVISFAMVMGREDRRQAFPPPLEVVLVSPPSLPTHTVDSLIHAIDTMDRYVSHPSLLRSSLRVFPPSPSFTECQHPISDRQKTHTCLNLLRDRKQHHAPEVGLDSLYSLLSATTEVLFSSFKGATLFRPAAAAVHVILILQDSTTSCNINSSSDSSPTVDSCPSSTVTTNMLEDKINELADFLFVSGVSHRVSFSIFTGRMTLSSAPGRFIGSPLVSSGYSDSSHFNPAFALRNIFESSKKEFTSSFQATVMVTGSLVRVYKLEDLSDENVILHLYDPGFPEPYDKRMDEYLLQPLEVGDSAQATTLDDNGGDVALGCSTIDISEEDYMCGEAEDGEAVIREADPTTYTNYTLDYLVKGSVEMKGWAPDLPFAQVAAKSLTPIVFKNTIATTFPALRKWKDFNYLAEYVSNVGEVKMGVCNKFYEPDQASKLRPLPKENFSRLNMTSKQLFETIKKSDLFPNTAGKVQYGAFFDIPRILQDDVPTDFLFVNEEDQKNRKQFLWVSSGGFNTFTHVDHDMNIFVQIVGYKRFTLFLPHEIDNLYMFPRVHSMWHKSRVDFFSPDLKLFPRFANATALTAILGPGDVLFIPPYTWHHVESLSSSVSLTTWNHVVPVYEAMEAAYGVELFFEKHMRNSTGRVFALRLFLDLLIQKVSGFNQTTSMVNRLIETRYNGLGYLFSTGTNETRQCDRRGTNTPNSSLIPTARFLYNDLNVEADLVANHFYKITTPEVRDILLLDFIEEVAQETVGTSHVYSFFYYCFRGQGYYYTSVGSGEHEMWS